MHPHHLLYFRFIRHFEPFLLVFITSALSLVFSIRLVSASRRWPLFELVMFVNIAGLLVFVTLMGFHVILSKPPVLYLVKFLTPEVPTVSWNTAVLALPLIYVHAFRRTYESLFVSVYSNSSTNVGHYIMGMVHYLILPLTVLCEAHGFVDGQTEKFTLASYSIRQWIGVVVYMYCNVQQHVCAQRMSNVRITADGLASHYGHGMFFGGWFNHVSCPHFLFEVGIYVALCLVIWNSVTYWCLLVFVVINQTFVAYKWYHKTFPKYPKDRYAISPYLQ